MDDLQPPIASSPPWTSLSIAPLAPKGVGVPGRVTRNVFEDGAREWREPPSSLPPDELRNARWLPLSALAASQGATSLVSELTARVMAHETACEARQNSRRKAGQEKLQAAVGAIIGGLLRRWGRDEPGAVCRSRATADFSGSPVGARQFIAAADGLIALGLLRSAKAIRYGAFSFGDGDVFLGRAPRYWPSPALLALAARSGVNPATVQTDFADIIPTAPPPVPNPVRVFAIKQRGRKDKQPLPRGRLGDQAERIGRDVGETNAFAAEHDVRGCLPPRWYRVFTEGPLLGGRWQAAGREGVYQVIPEVGAARPHYDKWRARGGGGREGVAPVNHARPAGSAVARRRPV